MVLKYDDSGSSVEVVDCANNQTISGVKYFDVAPGINSLTGLQLLSLDDSNLMVNPYFIIINETSTPGFGIGNLYVLKSEDGGSVMISIQNDSNTAGSDGRFDIRIAGSDGGDAYVNMDISGVGGWSFGLDNSDNDKFKIDHGGPAMPGVNTYLSIDPTTGDVTDHQGHFSISTAGKTLKVKQGSNACMGTGAVLAAGTVTVSTNAINTGDTVLLSCSALGGVPGIPCVPDANIVDGVSFDITSSSAADTSTYSWLIVKPA